jgi:hypothetical protein
VVEGICNTNFASLFNYYFTAMELLTSTVPIWVSILFLLAILIPIFMIAEVARKGALLSGMDAQQSKRIYTTILLFYGVYFSYVMLLSKSGILSENTLPPKILLFTTLPLILFYFFIISNLNSFKTILLHTPIESLVLIHSFRLIGVFFLITEAYGAIPTKFAYIGGIGDILTAILSIPVALAVRSKKTYSYTLVSAWNILGIADIISVLTTAIVTTRLSIETGSQNLTGIAEFPFSLIPAFAPATILFLHGLIFRKVWNTRVQ